MKGAVQVQQLHSAALEGNALGDPADRPLVVYLPPGYDTAGQRFPVVYFLHGFTGSGMQWLNASGFTPTVPQRLDNLISRGLVPPVIGVFPDGWTAIGGTQWDNSDGVGRYRDYLVQDVVPHVERTLRAIPDARARAAVGKSSGGYGALVMGRHHPDVFAHIGSHSGDAYFEYCYLPDFPKAAAALLKTSDAKAWFDDFLRRGQESKHRGDDHSVLNILGMAAAYSPQKGEPLGVELPFERETARLRPEVFERWLERDPVRFVPRHLDQFQKLSSIFVDCGTKDEFHLRWGARMVVEALRRAGMEAVHEEFEDGHLGINYRYDRSLSYLVPRLFRG
jgi:S-formylglutathione hydrolase FrmB